MAIDHAIPAKKGPSAKRPRTSATVPAPAEEEESKPNINGNGESKSPVSMTLADPYVLDCPNCFQPLSSPVFQCKNGHIACDSCCTAILKNKCSICSLTIGNIRNRAVELILGSVRVTCQHKSYGCTQTLTYSNKVDHEKTCTYVPCSCPCCDFVGNSKCLYDHFALKHKDSSREFDFGAMECILMSSTEKHVILRERKEGVLFVLNHCIETLGSFFNVVCVAPPSSEKISYELKAKIGDDSIRLRSSVEIMPKWTVQIPSKMSLVVPSNFLSTSQQLKLELIVRHRLFIFEFSESE